MSRTSRRTFLQRAATLGAATLAAGPLSRLSPAAERPKANISFGLVTYQWGADWDVQTIIDNCTKTKALGVELRTQHAHKVEPNLSAEDRREVRKRFADSPVTLIGLGTNQDFHDPDPAKVKKSIEVAKAFVKLSHDVGGSGVKVKPNDTPQGIPLEKTTAQIGRALNEVAAFAADYGQQIRLEVHGLGLAPRLPTIKRIMDVATRKNVGVCWNSNKTDLEAPGLEYNFNLVKNRLGATCHVHPFTNRDYPWSELLQLFVNAGYQGWWLMEAYTAVGDPVKALAEQREMFQAMLAKAQ